MVDEVVAFKLMGLMTYLILRLLEDKHSGLRKAKRNEDMELASVVILSSLHPKPNKGWEKLSRKNLANKFGSKSAPGKY